MVFGKIKEKRVGVSGGGVAVQVNVGGETIADAKVKKVVDEFEEKLKNAYKEALPAKDLD